MNRSPLVALLAVLLLISSGCAKKKTEEPLSVPAAPVTPPPPPPPPAKVYPEPIEFVPSHMTIAVGLRPHALDESKFCKSLQAQFSSVSGLADRLGFKFSEIESLWLASNSGRNAFLACLRTVQPFDVAATASRLNPGASSTAAQSPLVLAWPAGSNDNAIAIVDDRTLLVGRKASIDEAIARPGDGPVRIGVAALEEKTPLYWVAGNQQTAEEQAGQIALKDFQETVGDLVGFLGFASSAKFENGLVVGFSVVLQSETEAGRLRGLFDKPKSTVPLTVREVADTGSSIGKTKDRRLQNLIPEFGGAVMVQKVQYESQGGLVRARFESSSTLLSVGSDLFRATGGSVLGDGLFAGVLGTLGKAIDNRRSTGELPGAVFPENFEGNPNAGYSWMCHLLPYVGHQDLYDQFNNDFKKPWSEDPAKFALGCQQIGEFLNPANPRTRWKGYPYPGLALTHFVGISGVERKDSDVAARYERSDPRAGVFGYGRAAKNEEITDGLANTIMVAGNDRLSGPWIEAGGATIRGARNNPFDDFAGFHSDGLEKPGVYVLMADGSARIISADCNPKVFQAMCTIHGGEKIDLAGVPTTIRRIIAPSPAGAGAKTP